jgi:cell division septation protein DedD
VAPEPEQAPEPEPRVAATPEPEAAPPAATPEPEAAPPAATRETEAAPPAAGGAFSAWLISFKDAAEARAYLEAAQARHPKLFAGAPGAVSAARPGQGRTFHRVVAGGLASREAVRDLCRRLRAAEPDAFCKVLAN